METDKTLVDDVLLGKPRAFERLVQRHQRLVWSLVYRMVHHEADCEDLCQDVFMRVHRYLPKFRFDSALSTWIGQIAFSVAGRHLQRKRIPLLEVDGADEDPLAQLADKVDLQQSLIEHDEGLQVEAAMQLLPPLQRNLLNLYYLEELGIAEIAQITGQPEGTVKNYLFRARAAMRKLLTLSEEAAA